MYTAYWTHIVLALYPNIPHASHMGRPSYPFFFLLPFLYSPPISSLSSTQPTKRAKPVMPRPTRICGGKDADKVGAKQQPSSRLSGGVQGAVPCGAGDSEGFVSLMPQNKVM
jgi:hypothetical protein